MKPSGEVADMRFYFTAPGETADEGLEMPDAETALSEAADAALLMARGNGPAASTPDASTRMSAWTFTPTRDALGG
jgi:hypothetical protein